MDSNIIIPEHIACRCRLCKIEEPTVCEKCLTTCKIGRDREFKKKVYIKAGNKCEECGETDKRCLTVHHLDKENHPYNPDKCKILCLNCHWGKVHNMANRKND